MAAAGTGGFHEWREMRREQGRMEQMRAVGRTVLNNAAPQVVNGSEERRAMRELERTGEKGLELELWADWRR